MPNTPYKQYVCKCPNCAYPTSIQTSEIGEVPNDYLQCTRCKYIFRVSKLNDFHSLSQFYFSPEELEYCRGIIPNQQEIENTSFLKL
jgi:hypothetical protein